MADRKLCALGLLLLVGHHELGWAVLHIAVSQGICSILYWLLQAIVPATFDTLRLIFTKHLTLILSVHHSISVLWDFGTTWDPRVIVGRLRVLTLWLLLLSVYFIIQVWDVLLMYLVANASGYRFIRSDQFPCFTDLLRCIYPCVYSLLEVDVSIYKIGILVRLNSLIDFYHRLVHFSVMSRLRMYLC